MVFKIADDKIADDKIADDKASMASGYSGSLNCSYFTFAFLSLGDFTIDKNVRC